MNNVLFWLETFTKLRSPILVDYKEQWYHIQSLCLADIWPFTYLVDSWRTHVFVSHTASSQDSLFSVTQQHYCVDLDLGADPQRKFPIAFKTCIKKGECYLIQYKLYSSFFYFSTSLDAVQRNVWNSSWPHKI